MSCGGFRTPGMLSCGCGESGGSCSCGPKQVQTASSKSRWIPPGFSWAGAGVPVYGGSVGGFSIPSTRSAAPTQLPVLINPPHFIPPGMLSGTAGVQTTEGKRKQSSVPGCVAAHARGEMHTHTAQVTSSGRKHQASSQESGLGTSHAVFREGHTLERTGSGVPLARHGSISERPAHPGRGSQAHGDRRTSVPMGINRSSPAALPQERGGQFGPCHDWIQIPGTNIWFCTRTQEWINWDTGKRGYGVGTIDSENSRSVSPRVKNCKVQLWQKTILMGSGKRRSPVCHLWIEIYHCNGSWDRWEVMDGLNTSDPALGHIQQQMLGRGEASRSEEEPELVAEERLACTPADPFQCECISRKHMLGYPYRDRYSATGPNSTNFVEWVLKTCSVAGLADKIPSCALEITGWGLWLRNNDWWNPRHYLPIPMNLRRFQ